jgi:hypothetical protein
MRIAPVVEVEVPPVLSEGADPDLQAINIALAAIAT